MRSPPIFQVPISMFIKPFKPANLTNHVRIINPILKNGYSRKPYSPCIRISLQKPYIDPKKAFTIRRPSCPRRSRDRLRPPWPPLSWPPALRQDLRRRSPPSSPSSASWPGKGWGVPRVRVPRDCNISFNSGIFLTSC